MKLAGLAVATFVVMTMGAPVVSNPAEAAPVVAGALVPLVDDESLAPGQVEPATYYGYGRYRGYHRGYAYYPRYYGGYGYYGGYAYYPRYYGGYSDTNRYYRQHRWGY